MCRNGVKWSIAAGRSGDRADVQHCESPMFDRLMLGRLPTNRILQNIAKQTFKLG